MMSDPVELASGRGKETFFRVMIRGQINMIAITDRKANIVLGINLILASLVLGVFGGRLDIQNWNLTISDNIAIPLLVIFTTAIGSGVYAVLSTLPKLYRHEYDWLSNSTLARSFLKPEDVMEYITSVEKILQSREATYRSLIYDTYFLGMRLRRKFRLLRIAYIILLVGMIVSASTFLILVLLIA